MLSRWLAVAVLTNAGCFVLPVIPAASAQMFTLTNSTTPPTPGAGHDYTQLLNETVNPGNGSVSFQLNFPMPKGRGLSLPFSMSYNSGQVVFFDPFISSYLFDGYGPTLSSGVGGGVWSSSIGLVSSGGWTYGMPFANWNAWTAPTASNGNQTQQCPLTAGYTFTDLTGGIHSLGLGSAGNVQNQYGVPGPCTASATTGGDDFYSASITPSNFNGPVLNTPLTVSDQQTGTRYSFTGDTLEIPSSPQHIARTGLLPYLIEDRNGNQITATQSINSANQFTFAFTDSLKRPLLSDNGIQASPETITAGGLNYTVTWRTTSANYAVPTSANLSDLGANCAAPPSVNDTSIQVISSISLPNGQTYHFFYGDDNPHGISNPYGLISEIDYPDGGSIRYTWKLNDTYSDLADYTGFAPGGSTPTVVPDGCQYQYRAPVLASRTVFYNGTTSAAQTQGYTYSTTWNAAYPVQWDSKSTSVSTTDAIAKKTALKQYTYAGIPSDLPDYTHSSVSPQVALEQTVSTYDWGNTTTPINVSNKAWLDQYQLACEFHTLNGTAVSGHFYQYGPGTQLSDDKGYDIGQVANPASVCTGVASPRTPTPTAPSSPTPARETVRQFQSFTNLAGMTFSPPQSEILYGNGNKLAETDYAYAPGPTATATAIAHDETNYGPSSTLSRGNPTSITRVNNTGVSSVTTMAYDETGQVVSVTDPCGNTACGDVVGTNHTTTYSYTDSPVGGNAAGNSNAYLTTVTAPNTGVAHVSSSSYNYAQGLLTESIDQNGHATDYSYSDPLMRLTDTYDPPSAQNGGQRPHTHTAYVDGTGATVTTTDPSGEVSTATLDGFGRTVKTQLTSDPSGVDTVDTVYNGIGQTASVTNPYRDGDPAAGQPGSTRGTSLYSYDALGRKTLQTNQDGSTEQWMPLGNVTDFYNELGKHWQRVYDGFGDLMTVMEPDAGNNLAYETDYQYDGRSNLIHVDQWGGPKGNAGDRVRGFMYDGLSRLTSSTNPEAGTIGYTYDANGNLQTKTDARSVVTTYNYDALNRLTGKSYGNDPSGTPPVTIAYDAPKPGWTLPSETYAAATPTAVAGISQSNLVGHVSYEANSSATVVYGYDEAGRTVLKSECTPSTCAANDHYDMHALYDLTGNTVFTDLGVDSARNAATPNAGYYYGGLSLSYAANGKTANQLLSGTADVVDATHPGAIVFGLQYSALGSMTGASFGGVYAESNQYSPRGWITSRTGTITAINYSRVGALMHDLAGNVTQLNDSFTNSVATYVPDQLNRLMSYSGPFGAATYGYDAWGNLTNHTNTAGQGYTYSLTMTPQNRVSPTGSTDSAFFYDASGNVLADGLNNYSYDAEGRLAAVSGSNLYLYGPEGDRVATVQGGAVAFEYLYGIDGTLTTTVDASGNLVRGLLYGGGMHLADYTKDGKTEFHLSDEVGSLVNTIDQTGSPVESCAADPFGESLNCSPSVDFTENHFTDKKRDQESGLDYFGARYYGSTFGRFMSPDPVFISAQRLMDPQSLNLYSYVRNNPLGLTDDTGLDFYLACQTSDHSGCGQVQNGSSSSWVQGQTVNGSFQAADVDMNKQGDASAGYSDQFGNNYSGAFDQNNGVSFTNTSTGATSGGSQFIDGSDNTQVNGSGAFSNISGNFFSACGGSCQGRAALSGSAAAFAATEAQLNKQGGLTTALDRLSGAHKGGAQWKDSNGYVHMLQSPSGSMEMHFEGHPTGVDVQQFVLHMVDTIRDASSGRANQQKNATLPQ